MQATNEAQTAAPGLRAPTRMERLRQSTHLVHARLEGSLALVQPALTASRYLQILEAFYGYYAPLEPLVMRAVAQDGAALALELRTKVPLLEADLSTLGRTRAQIDELPRCEDLPCVAQRSQALGALYVMEGATLGGQIIGRYLRDHLGIDAGSGARFFAGYGVETRARWLEFSRHLDGAADIDDALLLAAAVSTFERLECWLDVASARS
jgi:heme oxygenase